MALYFKDRIPDPIHGENARYYDAVGNNGAVKLPDFKLVLKNNIAPDKTGDPVSAENLNFASGNMSFPCPVAIQRGQHVTQTRHGAIPSRTYRGIAVTGSPWTEAQLEFGCIRLSDTRFVLIHNNRARILDANIPVSTATLRTPLIWTWGVVRPGTMSVIQTLYEAWDRAIVAGLQQPAEGGQISTYSFIADALAAGTLTVLGSYNFPGGHTHIMSNVAAVSNARGLAITRDGANMYASLLNYAGTPVTLVQQITLSGIANAAAITNIGLFTVDKANGRCVYLYHNGTSVFALPLTVTGSTVTAGAVQTVAPVQGTGAINQNNVLTGMDYASADNDRFSGGSGGRIILVGSNGTAMTNTGMRVQILSADTSGVITRGNIFTLDEMNNPRVGMASITNKSPEKIIISGTDEIPGFSGRGGCLAECAVSGAQITSQMKFHPFRDSRLLNTSDTHNFMRTYAIQNPANPDSFLFLQQYSWSNGVYTMLNNLVVWYGFRYDFALANHILGIALENSANGRVRVQTSAKYLPGMYTNLPPFNRYVAGINGRLDVANISDPNAIAVAVTDTDLMFFGARGY